MFDIFLSILGLNVLTLLLGLIMASPKSGFVEIIAGGCALMTMFYLLSGATVLAITSFFISSTALIMQRLVWKWQVR